MKYELSIEVLDETYVDALVVALARQGYAPYISEDGKDVCITITDCELTEIKEDK